MTKSCLFVGPLPPPVGGFSNVTKSVFEILRDLGWVLFLVNRSRVDRSTIKSLNVCYFFIQSLWLFCRSFLWVFRYRPKNVYIALSGGYGQLIDLLYVLLARLFSADIVFHHHSYAYINEKKFLFQLVLYFSGASKNIVLCRCMADAMIARYPVFTVNKSFQVISNASFSPIQYVDAEASLQLRTNEGSVKVGFLSNITEEKGVFEVFSLANIVGSYDANISFVIAGPVDPAIEVRFFDLLKLSSNIEYVGSIYDSKKRAFFEGLDIFVFPTMYVNEAEPLVIIEALSCGAIVLANNRGCIGGMECGGSVFVNPGKDFSVWASALILSNGLNLSRNDKVCRATDFEHVVASRAATMRDFFSNMQ